MVVNYSSYSIEDFLTSMSRNMGGDKFQLFYLLFYYKQTYYYYYLLKKKFSHHIGELKIRLKIVRKNI